MNTATSKLSDYIYIAPLCSKGHICLVKNKTDGCLYVKKELEIFNPDVFFTLKNTNIPDIPKIYDIYHNENKLIIIEEFVSGITLSEHIATKGCLSEKETVDIILQVTDILRKLHSLKPCIIHRDIKPSNIILCPDGKIKLIDFNAAKIENQNDKRDTVLLGTEGFAAPEQYGFSPSSPLTDIYAVGVLANVCLTEKLPNDEISNSKLTKIILKCTELNPKERFQSTYELSRAIKKAYKTKCSWLPVGFRSLKVHKMVTAVLYYLFLFSFIISMEYDFFESEKAKIRTQLTFLVSGILIPCFYFNYLGFKDIFPFMKSGNTILKIIGYILGPLIIFALAIFVLAIVFI